MAMLLGSISLSSFYLGSMGILYAPLLAGATTIFWHIIEEYRVTVMFTAPTALRAIRRDDGENFFFEMLGSRGGLRTLRALFLGGERSEPRIVEMYQRLPL